MRLFLLLILAPLSAHAVERYVSSAELPSIVDAYSRAAKLQLLRPFGNDQLRIWTLDYMSGQVEGYVISDQGGLRCSTRFGYSDESVGIETARCHEIVSWLGAEGLESTLDALAGLDGRNWVCPVLDGAGVYIEGLRNGKRFTLGVANPDACDDPGSQTVVGVMRKLPP